MAKVKVTLRERKSTKTDRTSLYLEYYKGYTKDAEGKIRNIKDYETLDFYLYTNPKTPTEKQHNKEAKSKAEILRSEREKSIINGNNGFKSDFKQKTNLIDYFKTLTNERFDSQGNYGNWDSALKHLINYCNAATTFEQVDVKFVEGFRDYLLTKAKMSNGKLLSNNSALSYFNKFRAAINQAYDEEIISDNPIKKVRGIKQIDTHRSYLTLDELKVLAKTECRYEVLKRAFIFSCLTGLRWSDIQKLVWSEIEKFNNGWRVKFTQQKTKGAEYLDISDQAFAYLGEIGQPIDRVFTGLKYSSYMNVALTQWMIKAGITKPITFHCARHSFATIQLTLGTEIYTVSKLLGHSELKTTQIYAKIIDQKKIEAVNKIPNLID
ncbi:MAG: site-specific integrase [Flavipsychrobacter sp.]|nr:site-specific integrase [Flavipsychrobacter sp.]